MGREPLEPSAGMIFEWPVEMEICVFNEGVGFPIDIVFANAEGSIVAIERDVAAGDATTRCHLETATMLEIGAGEAAAFSVGDVLERR